MSFSILRYGFGENKMKKLTLILLLFFIVSQTACSKDAQANAFLKQYDEVISEIAEKLEEGKIDEAQKVFDENEKSLNAKFDDVKRSLSIRFSAETKKRINTEPQKNMTALAETANKAIKKNPQNEAKIQALVLDIANVVRR